METNVNYTIVGVFVIALTAAIILGIVWLSAGLSLQRQTTYEVDVTESVGGMNVDSPVEFNGVPVGTISEINLDKTNPSIIKVLFKIKNDTPVTKGTIAVLSTRGLTGFTYLSLQDKGRNSTPLTAEPGQPYPVIPTAPSLVLRLEKAFNEVTSELRQVSNSFNTLLSPENQQQIRQSLINIRSISETISANKRQLNNILQNTSKASQEFQPLIQAGVSSMQQLDSATNSINELATDVKQNPALLIRGRSQPTLGPGEK